MQKTCHQHFYNAQISFRKLLVIDYIAAPAIIAIVSLDSEDLCLDKYIILTLDEKKE